MSPVREALDSGVTPRMLEVAAHEVGHALAWQAGGFTIKGLRIVTGLFGGVSDADCTVSNVWLDGDNIDAYLIGLMGGAAGQTRFLTRHRGRGGWSASGAARGNSSWDISQFRRFSRAHGGSLSVAAATRRAEAIVNRAGHRADALTVRLARSGRLSGGAL